MVIIVRTVEGTVKKVFALQIAVAKNVHWGNAPLDRKHEKHALKLKCSTLSWTIVVDMTTTQSTTSFGPGPPVNLFFSALESSRTRRPRPRIPSARRDKHRAGPPGCTRRPVCPEAGSVRGKQHTDMDGDLRQAVGDLSPQGGSPPAERAHWQAGRVPSRRAPPAASRGERGGWASVAVEWWRTRPFPLQRTTTRPGPRGYLAWSESRDLRTRFSGLGSPGVRAPESPSRHHHSGPSEPLSRSVLMHGLSWWWSRLCASPPAHTIGRRRAARAHAGGKSE